MRNFIGIIICIIFTLIFQRLSAQVDTLVNILTGKIEFKQNLIIEDQARAHFDSVFQLYKAYAIKNNLTELSSEEMEKNYEGISLVELLTSWFSSGQSTINFNNDSILINTPNPSSGEYTKAVYNKKANTVWKKYNQREKEETTIVFMDSLFRIDQEKHFTKKILGYDCHKVIVTSVKEEIEYLDEEQKISLDFGKSVYEMWVTYQINLPVYSITKDLVIKENIGFPMEAVLYSSKVPGVKYIFNVTDVIVN